MTRDLGAELRAALGRSYRIERELGAGGMATVYLAHDLWHGRKVAIKVLRPELAAAIGAERFVREIQTIAALQHPHILGGARVAAACRSMEECIHAGGAMDASCSSTPPTTTS